MIGLNKTIKSFKIMVITIFEILNLISNFYTQMYFITYPLNVFEYLKRFLFKIKNQRTPKV